ncbi:phosphate ABC transporter substrate-binding protein PstS family protein [Vagococcus acidifermentans]|uniref:Phosphate-binding protein n=1 Tax=Vagococcus acidifermentans TaxID=564710 RepID=A0A430AVH2_9ENTE|nr:phosphate ABC transporter substrate-binding protein PstS family protein [Vagococcus acidifermentans]RSU12058.1 phosphate ABC transporter substrate-binding protein [Vagococcus acidifermentans]
MKKLLFSASLIFSVILAVGCGSSDNKGGSSASTEKGKSSEKVSITAVGSTAIQPLVEKASEIYMTDNPNYSITVQGGGSGTGLSQVSSGAVDIGNSDLFAEEKDGIDAGKLEDHKIAVVGIAPIVNKDAGVTGLTMQQLRDVFTGKVTNWKEVGGKDMDVALVNRAEGSGTRATFEKWVLDGASAAKGQEQDSSGTVHKIVAETPGAVSYLAFSYIDDAVQAIAIDGVEPKAENVLDNSWTIWAYEHMYTQKDTDKNILVFLDFMKSADVQEHVIKELGYIPISDMKVERDVDGKVK